MGVMEPLIKRYKVCLKVLGVKNWEEGVADCPGILNSKNKTICKQTISLRSGQPETVFSGKNKNADTIITNLPGA